jgi:hypothetical protein
MIKTRHYPSLLLLPALLMFGGLAKADLCSSDVTFAALIADGACTISDKTFSDFTLSGTATGGAVALTSADVVVSIIDTTPGDPATSEIGLQFNFSLDATSGQTNDLAITYDIAVTPGNPGLAIASAELEQTSAITGGALGGAFATVGENICLGGCPGPTEVLATNSFSHFDSVGFSGVQNVGIQKDINVNGGTTPTSSASISIVDNTVDQTVATPEPASIVFFGTMLLGLTALIRKRQVKRP